MKPLCTGIDIIEIARISKALEIHGERFLHRVFTLQERQYCLGKTSPTPSLAARFAAKEAVSKAIGTGIGSHLRWKDIEIIKVHNQPSVRLPQHIYEQFGIKKILLSLSHCRDYATAIAIALG